MHTSKPSSQNVGQDFIVLDFFHGQKILKVDGRDGSDPQNREKNAPAGRFSSMPQTLFVGINISGNSPFGTPALTKNAERYEW
jgi:hypothetical protein